MVTTRSTNSNGKEAVDDDNSDEETPDETTFTSTVGHLLAWLMLSIVLIRDRKVEEQINQTVGLVTEWLKDKGQVSWSAPHFQVFVVV